MLAGRPWALLKGRWAEVGLWRSGSLLTGYLVPLGLSNVSLWLPTGGRESGVWAFGATRCSLALPPEFGVSHNVVQRALAALFLTWDTLLVVPGAPEQRCYFHLMSGASGVSKPFPLTMSSFCWSHACRLPMHLKLSHRVNCLFNWCSSEVRFA